ncbi:MAG: GrpB family protein [Lachnospiraceae bacterium]|nr:GrpB family protein [Lachnospiraceae bacterium]
MTGLRRGAVMLCDHEKEWEIEAQKTIERLHRILGMAAKDIQHVGSTSILTIKAKPIIDIAVAVDSFDEILALKTQMEAEGFYYRPQENLSDQILFAYGNFYDGTGDLQTHFIHVVLTGSMQWINYINFRDYLNAEPSIAKSYEDLKLSLAQAPHDDNIREQYTNGKHDFIVHTLRKALVKSYLGKTITIKIDRPLGSAHPRNPDIIYPVNYGYIPNVTGGDGEELDVYLLGVEKPVKEYTARVVGIVHRHNDAEDKLIAAPDGMNFTPAEMEKLLHFQEQYFESCIEVW